MSISIPVPDSGCPVLATTAAGGTTQASGLGAIANLASSIGSMFETITSWIGNPSKFVSDVGNWVTYNFLGYNMQAPDCYQPTSAYGAAKSIITGDLNLGASPIYQDAYSVLVTAGLALVLLAGMSRAAKVMDGHEAHVGAVAVDVIPRVLVGIAAIEVGFAALGALVDVTSKIGVALLGELVGVAGQGGIANDPLALILGQLPKLLLLGPIAGILLIAVLFFLFRLLALLYARFLILTLGIVFTPVMVAIAVFDTRATVVRWWVGMMFGALVTPIVCAGVLGATLGLAVRFYQGDSSISSGFESPFLGAMICVGGIWLAGKAIHALLFSSTAGNHGGVMAFVRHSAEMLATIPFAAATVVGAGSKIASLATKAASAGGGGSAGGAGVMSLVGKSASSSAPRGASAAFSAFRSNSAGASLAQQATPEMAPGTSPSARWASLLGRPELSGAIGQLQGSAHAAETRTGDPTPTDSDRHAFIAAVRGAEPSMAVAQEEVSA